jgi:hypothetical protein
MMKQKVKISTLLSRRCNLDFREEGAWLFGDKMLAFRTELNELYHEISNGCKYVVSTQ